MYFHFTTYVSPSWNCPMLCLGNRLHQKWINSMEFRDHLITLSIYNLSGLNKQTNQPHRIYSVPVVKFQNMPHIHRQSANLKVPPVISLHHSITSPHVYAVQNSPNQAMGQRQHQRHIIRLAFTTLHILQHTKKKERKVFCILKSYIPIKSVSTKNHLSSFLSHSSLIHLNCITYILWPATVINKYQQSQHTQSSLYLLLFMGNYKTLLVHYLVFNSFYVIILLWGSLGVTPV